MYIVSLMILVFHPLLFETFDMEWEMNFKACAYTTLIIPIKIEHDFILVTLFSTFSRRQSPCLTRTEFRVLVLLTEKQDIITSFDISTKTKTAWRKNLTIIVSWAIPIKALNLMCEIGMSFYQYWHKLMHF